MFKVLIYLKSKCSLLNGFSCPDGSTPNFGLIGPNNTFLSLSIYIYIYIKDVYGSY